MTFYNFKPSQMMHTMRFDRACMAYVSYIIAMVVPSVATISIFSSIAHLELSTLVNLILLAGLSLSLVSLVLTLLLV